MNNDDKKTNDFINSEQFTEVLKQNMAQHNNSSKLGIGYLNPLYLSVDSTQNVFEEVDKINAFLNLYMGMCAYREKRDIHDYKLEFINYGKTELVYVLTKNTGEMVTVLVKQPAVKLGDVEREAINLIELKKIDKNVVAPIDYFKYGDQELFVTPYIYQARCVASYTDWGMYIPEPNYRFVNFDKKQRSIVNKCMIAKLISYYDYVSSRGVVSCKLGGGDFMLPKGWEDMEPTVENTLDNLHLIACREMLQCSLQQYIKIIEHEFSKKTIDLDQERLIINHRGRVAMSDEEIEEGIKLGLKLLYKRKQQEQQNNKQDEEENEQ